MINETEQWKQPRVRQYNETSTGIWLNIKCNCACIFSHIVKLFIFPRKVAVYQCYFSLRDIADLTESKYLFPELSPSCRGRIQDHMCFWIVVVYFGFRKADTLQSYINNLAQHSFLSTLLPKAYCYVVQKNTFWQVASFWLQDNRIQKH
jgi:hypothetical protein